MLIEVFLMCAMMTNGTTVPDCDEQWVVLIFDDIDLDWICNPELDPEKVWVHGCSGWMDNRGMYMLVGENGYAKNGAGEYTFRHEVRHLWCLCHWHDDPPEPPKR